MNAFSVEKELIRQEEEEEEADQSPSYYEKKPQGGYFHLNKPISSLA